jgi:hypothetical protein
MIAINRPAMPNKVTSILPRHYSSASMGLLVLRAALG